MKRHRLAVYLAGVVASALTATAVNAASIVNSPTGLISPDTTITFSEFVFPENTVITNQYSSLGVEFSSGGPGGLIYKGSTGNPPPNLANFFGALDDFNPFSIHFSQAVSSAAFGYINNLSTDTFTPLLNGVAVAGESFAFKPSTQSFAFFGFTGILFDEIRIDIGPDFIQQFGPHMRIDNLQFVTAVPLPAALPLFSTGLGLLGLFGLWRRRKAKVDA